MLRRVIASNFRCLRYVDQPLGPFHVLVGPNASGKSAFFDVIQFSRDLLRHGLQTAVLGGPEGRPARRASRVDELIFQQQADLFELVVELTIPEALRGDWAGGGDAWARYEVAVGSRGPNGEVEVLGETLWRCTGRARAAEPPAPSLFPADDVWRPVHVRKGAEYARAPSGWRKIVHKTSGGNATFRGESKGWNLTFRVGPDRSALEKLPEDPERFPVALWVRDVLSEGVKTLALDMWAMRRPASPSVQRGFLPDGSNLPLVIRGLRQGGERRFRQWLGHVRTVLDDVTDIEVVERPEDNHAYVVVEYAGGGQPVPSWLLSDGTLRFLALTLLPYVAQGPAIYLVEEPENGIHPKAVDAVYDSLSSVYEGHVSLATHSPLILSLAAQRREQILCFARSASGATNIVPGDRHPALADWEGRPDLSILYAAGVLG
jgi:predicted ATPase